MQPFLISDLKSYRVVFSKHPTIMLGTRPVFTAYYHSSEDKLRPISSRYDSNTFRVLVRHFILFHIFYMQTDTDFFCRISLVIIVFKYLFRSIVRKQVLYSRCNRTKQPIIPHIADIGTERLQIIFCPTCQKHLTHIFLRYPAIRESGWFVGISVHTLPTFFFGNITGQQAVLKKAGGLVTIYAMPHGSIKFLCCHNQSSLSVVRYRSRHGICSILPYHTSPINKHPVPLPY